MAIFGFHFNLEGKTCCAIESETPQIVGLHPPPRQLLRVQGCEARPASMRADTLAPPSGRPFVMFPELSQPKNRNHAKSKKGRGFRGTTRNVRRVFLCVFLVFCFPKSQEKRAGLIWIETLIFLLCFGSRLRKRVFQQRARPLLAAEDRSRRPRAPAPDRLHGQVRSAHRSRHETQAQLPGRRGRHLRRAARGAGLFGRGAPKLAELFFSDNVVER